MLRRVRDVALVIAPLLLAAVLTLAVTVVLGKPLNYANIIALPLLFGIGVAFDIYFVMNWRAGQTNHLQSGTARAVLFSALTTMAAFGSLALSPDPGTAEMGMLLSISLSCTLFCALIVLPALLGPALPASGAARRKQSASNNRPDASSRRRAALATARPAGIASRDAPVAAVGRNVRRSAIRRRARGTALRAMRELWQGYATDLSASGRLRRPGNRDGEAGMRVVLAQPRGFCAGVERAIEIVERALEKYGPPIYVRHEIVHNRHVVERLRAKGARFVDEIDEVPPGAVTIFSAHGVASEIERRAGERGLPVIDATCPLVSKVHIEGQRYANQGREIILIGHAGHPEIEGTMGRITGRVHLISRPEEVADLQVANPDKLAFITQTTLSVDDTRAVIDALKARFPSIVGPDTKDICYATQNRQRATRELAKIVDIVLVVGAPNSSNSNRLREIAAECGVPSYLIEDAAALDPALAGGSALGRDHRRRVRSRHPGRGAGRAAARDGRGRGRVPAGGDRERPVPHACPARRYALARLTRRLALRRWVGTLS